MRVGECVRRRSSKIEESTFAPRVALRVNDSRRRFARPLHAAHIDSLGVQAAKQLVACRVLPNATDECALRTEFAQCYRRVRRRAEDFYVYRPPYDRRERWHW